jgi:hypothetical protein
MPNVVVDQVTTQTIEVLGNWHGGRLWLDGFCSKFSFSTRVRLSDSGRRFRILDQ